MGTEAIHRFIDLAAFGLALCVIWWAVFLDE